MLTLFAKDMFFELNVGREIATACASAGITFNCNTGVCGSCLVTVLSGGEYLSELTDEEKDLGLDGSRRLACQCRIKSGTVKLTF